MTHADLAMTKSELVRLMAARQPHMSQRDMEVVVNTILHAMTEALVVGDRIEIRGFGSFAVRERRGRTGRNPKSGAMIEVQAKRVPFFSAGHQLRQRLMRAHAREHSDDQSMPAKPARG